MKKTARLLLVWCVAATGARLQDFIVSLPGDAVLGAVRVAPVLSVVAFIAWLTWAGTRLSTALFRQVEAGRWMTSWLTPETATITRKLVSLALVLFAMVMAYPYLPGSDTEAFNEAQVQIMSPHDNNDPPGNPKPAPGSPEVAPRPA